MTSFKVKKIQTPLFGVVEATNKDPWHQAFSNSGTTTNIELDDDALDFIADELERDAECLAKDAERYVRGLYRAKTRGMGGSQLGDFGEVLALLLNLGDCREVFRVVSWQRGQGQPIKGSRFPQPDFLVKQAGSLCALEVKSTEAFKFVDLRDTPKKWTQLKPCGAVAKCRSEALL
ncbi:MAG: hypothetical protein H0U74_19605 [Bradymonadaceae bacterium]|nr:hypothetical protein [Lujinxingiaceae bacterium]